MTPGLLQEARSVIAEQGVLGKNAERLTPTLGMIN